MHDQRKFIWLYFRLIVIWFKPGLEVLIQNVDFDLIVEVPYQLLFNAFLLMAKLAWKFCLYDG